MGLLSRLRNLYRKPAAGLLSCLLAASLPLGAEPISDIANTRHNLSNTGPGTATAVTESQICVFCHTPHRAAAKPGAPLWNRQDSGAAYTPYNSDTINASDIAATPGGTNVTINMTGTGPGGVIPSGQGDTTGYTRKLGEDLTNDHPISFTYNAALAAADGELRNPASETYIANPGPGSKPLVPLENDQVQCTSRKRPGAVHQLP
jgi:hypothetical protein